MYSSMEPPVYSTGHRRSERREHIGLKHLIMIIQTTRKDGDSMTTESSANQDAASTDEHVRKVRRRVEDVLRKSDAETILSVAKFLRVSTEIKPTKEEQNGH